MPLTTTFEFTVKPWSVAVVKVTTLLESAVLVTEKVDP